MNPVELLQNLLNLHGPELAPAKTDDLQRQLAAWSQLPPAEQTWTQASLLYGLLVVGLQIEGRLAAIEQLVAGGTDALAVLGQLVAERPAPTTRAGRLELVTSPTPPATPTTPVVDVKPRTSRAKPADEGTTPPAGEGA
jgi:hypothetical protein